MSANPIDKNTTPKTTGNLEELFRHHLGEEAAAPTRPMLWDQIDNSLLLRQNETYRRRLTVTRWVAAASLLLATLAGTGWWSLRDSGLGRPAVATTGRPSADAATTSHANTANGNQRNSAGGKAAEMVAATTTPAPPQLPATPAAAPTGAAARTTGFGSERPGRELGQSREIAGQVPAQSAGLGRLAATGRVGSAGAAGVSGVAAVSAGASASGTTSASGAAFTSGAASASGVASAAGIAPASASASAAGIAGAGRVSGALPTAGASSDAGLMARSGLTQTAGRVPGTGSDATKTIVAAATGTTTAASSLTLAVTGSPAAAISAGPATGAMGLLAAHPAALSLTSPVALPNGLTALTLPADAGPVLPTAVPHRWKYSANYTAGIFNPNVNFSRAGISPDCDYNPALGPDSPAQTEAAATQYRQNLRPGLSQRLALQAARHLTGNWSLSTGVELNQASASSASASAFVGEQLLDLGQPSNGELRTTNFRYRMASLPLELRYANPVKRGWSLYGHLGGVVSALLGVRSDVEGNPEATRTYSIMSAGSPYRRLLSNLRGGAGMQFRPNTGHWTLGVGPVAEIGLVSLNAHPAQSYFAQSRAYGFGVEASLEFGR